MNGPMNNETNITMSSAVRTTSFRQLNFHPSIILCPKDSS